MTILFWNKKYHQLSISFYQLLVIVYLYLIPFMSDSGIHVFQDVIHVKYLSVEKKMKVKPFSNFY